MVIFYLIVFFSSVRAPVVYVVFYCFKGVTFDKSSFGSSVRVSGIFSFSWRHFMTGGSDYFGVCIELCAIYFYNLILILNSFSLFFFISRTSPGGGERFGRASVLLASPRPST